MSSTSGPPYTGEPLPNGWRALWDPNYEQHYFVDEITKKSHWVHPAQQERDRRVGVGQYAPPPGSPGRAPAPQYGQQNFQGQPQQQQPRMFGFGGGNQAQQPYYPQGAPPQGYYPQQQFYPQQQYNQPPPQPYPQQYPQQGGGGLFGSGGGNSHTGRNLALGAGAGLLGGVLLADAFEPNTVIENNNFNDSNNNFDSGNMDSGNNDFDGGNDFGGGDDFGGGF